MHPPEATMQSALLVEGTDPIRCAVRVHARRAPASWAAVEREVDDRAQDLALHVLQRWPSFDPSRGGAATFADRVARSAALNFAHEARTQKRGHGWARVPLEDAEPHLAHDPEAGGLALILDVRRLVDSLDPDAQSVCAAVAHGPVSEAARALDLSRAALRRRIAHIRRAFESAGMRTYLEAA